MKSSSEDTHTHYGEGAILNPAANEIWQLCNLCERGT